MPLLRKKTLERSTTLPEFLRDDEEVFHCVKTNEIFRNYDEYCERIILVNSMVWSCAMTGRPNLTYAEALQSEEEAKKLLKDFPVDLRVPIIYLASLTKRSWLGEMLEDVHMFARDRYFIGETVEACLKEDEPWCECLVIQVAEPSKEAIATYTSENRKQNKNDTAKNSETAGHPASLYSYDLMPLDDENHVEESVTVNALSVRRKKNMYTRAKNKLFIKQFVEQSKGIFRIKDSVIQKYGINKVQFDRIFAGCPPSFQASKKNQTKSATANTSKSKTTSNTTSNSSQPSPSPPKKVKQETMAKYLTKTEKFQGTKQSEAMAKNKEKDKLKKIDNKSVKIKKDNPSKNDKNLAEEMKRVSEELKQKSILKKKAVAEEKLKEKLKKREEESKFLDYMRQWKKVRDDLELNDQKMLPEATPVDTFTTNKNFSKFMEILEFLHTFSAELRVKHFFSSGITWDVVERALTLREVNGPLVDILQVLLSAIFNFVDAEHLEKHKHKSKIKVSDELPFDPRKRAVELATRSTKFILLHYGQDLSKTRLDAVTLSEVLRLHLLSSGAECTEGGARWRYQQRGGYSAMDDAGLQLRLSHPHILKALTTFHICELPLDDILTIITCLINQLLTFVNIRDITEDRIEKAIKARFELRKLQLEQAKRQKIYQAERLRIINLENAEKSDDASDIVNKIDKATQDKLLLDLETEYNKYKDQSKQQFQDFMQVQFAYQMYLGSDRAHRRYWLFESVPGLFVEHDEKQAGSCLFDIVPQYPFLATNNKNEFNKQIRLLYEEQQSGNDKENKDISVSKKSVDKMFLSLPSAENFQRSKELLMCTANNDLCLVHGSSSKPTWSFYHTVEDIDKLISSLNVRGVRESSLKAMLEQNHDLIVYHIENKVPLERLNKSINGITEIKKRTYKKYNENNTNLNFPAGTDTNVILDATLREYILDLEQNIFKGCLGSLKVKDRDAWRKAVESSSYDMQCDEIYWGPEKIYSEKKGIKTITNGFANKINGHSKGLLEDKTSASDNESGDDDDDEPANNKFEDPAEFLEAFSEFESEDTEESCKNMKESPELQKKVYALACALLQVEQAVANRFFKAPFGYKSQKATSETTIRKMERKALRLLGRWEISLMNSKSFAQVFLHYNCLEDSIIWTQSAAGARCRVCRRGGDAQNMLLCDICNKGQHLYCLKPPLEKIPEGDWFCQFCRPADPAPETKRRRRRIFNYDVEDETKYESAESEEEESDNEESDEDQESDELDEASDEESDEDIKSKSNKSNSPEAIDLCKTCNSGGELIGCDSCNVTYHFECVQPPLKRAPRGNWKCNDCNPRKKREREATQEYANHHEPRRCATQSRSRILEFTRSLRRGSVDDETDTSEKPVPASRRTLENGRRSRRAHDSDDDLLLHNVELQELLADISKHKDSWPFMRPVSKQDVPDYFDIIKNPMDFSKIKSKLNLGEYTTDKEILDDILLVFQNCDSYNNNNSPVFKAGARLEKFVNKRCKELHLSIPESTIEPDAKKQRTTN